MNLCQLSPCLCLLCLWKRVLTRPLTKTHAHHHCLSTPPCQPPNSNNEAFGVHHAHDCRKHTMLYQIELLTPCNGTASSAHPAGLHKTHARHCLYDIGSTANYVFRAPRPVAWNHSFEPMELMHGGYAIHAIKQVYIHHPC